MEPKIIALKLLSSFGLSGFVHAKLFVDQKILNNFISKPGIFCDENDKFLVISSIVKANNGFRIKVEGINSPEDAIMLRNKEIFIEKSLLPALEEDEFYFSDLENGEVFLGGEKIGKVRSVQNFGSEDLLEIELNSTENCDLMDENIQDDLNLLKAREKNKNFSKKHKKSVFIPFNKNCVGEIKTSDQNSSVIEITEFCFENYIKNC